MSKVLSDTSVIASKPVLETCNPDYSCFRNSTPGRTLEPMKNPDAGNESLHHAVQVLRAKRPGDC